MVKGIFTIYNWILQEKIQLVQICNFFADSKIRAQELSNYVSLVIFGHQTWDLKGGEFDPPPAFGFQVPQQG